MGKRRNLGDRWAVELTSSAKSSGTGCGWENGHVQTKERYTGLILSEDKQGKGSEKKKFILQ